MSSTEQVVSELCPAMGREVSVRVVYQVDYSRMCPVSVEPVAVKCLEAEACKARHNRIECLVYGNNLITTLLAGR